MITTSYKFNGEIKEISVTQTNFAKFIGLSQQKVSNMLADEEIVRDESDHASRVMLAESLRAYYLSSKATGDSVSYWKEKALREQVNRKLDELKLSKANGEVYLAETVESAWAELMIILRNNLTGLPSKLAAQLENKSRDEINLILQTEIDSMLKDLSEHQP